MKSALVTDRHIYFTTAAGIMSSYLKYSNLLSRKQEQTRNVLILAIALS